MYRKVHRRGLFYFLENALAVDLATFHTLVADAQTALAAGDYDTAYNKAGQAELIYLALPVRARSGGAGGVESEYKQVARIREVIEQMQTRATRRGDNRRMITTRTGFQ